MSDDCARVKVFSSGRNISIYISGEIREPENYIEEIDTIRNAGGGDTITLYINSLGGNLVTAMQIRAAIIESSAVVRAVVEGECCSAATILFLSADEMITGTHSVFMFHNYSGGMWGKGGELYEQANFEKRWSTALMTDLYKGVLTTREIKAMLEGKDFWFTGEEIINRITEADDE